MLAVTCTAQSMDDPLSGLTVGERPEPAVPDGWVRVSLKAAALNHHDLWSLKGVGLPADKLPMVLGCDGAGLLDDGTEVVVHAVVTSPTWTGDDTLDPKRSLLSEVHDGTLAEQVVVPARNVLPKPAESMNSTSAFSSLVLVQPAGATAAGSDCDGFVTISTPIR